MRQVAQFLWPAPTPPPARKVDHTYHRAKWRNRRVPDAGSPQPRHRPPRSGATDPVRQVAQSRRRPRMPSRHGREGTPDCTGSAHRHAKWRNGTDTDGTGPKPSRRTHAALRPSAAARRGRAKWRNAKTRTCRHAERRCLLARQVAHTEGSDGSVPRSNGAHCAYPTAGCSRAAAPSGATRSHRPTATSSGALPRQRHDPEHWAMRTAV